MSDPCGTLFLEDRVATCASTFLVDFLAMQ